TLSTLWGRRPLWMPRAVPVSRLTLGQMGVSLHPWSSTDPRTVSRGTRTLCLLRRHGGLLHHQGHGSSGGAPPPPAVVLGLAQNGAGSRESLPARFSPKEQRMSLHDRVGLGDAFSAADLLDPRWVSRHRGSPADFLARHRRQARRALRVG